MIERRYYGLYELEGWLAEYEHKYGLTSEEFYRLHLFDSVELLARVRRFDRHVWASYYREAKEIARRRERYGHE